MKTSLFVIAAGLTLAALMQSPSAQPANTAQTMEETARLPPSEDVKKAIAAMSKRSQ